MLSYGGVVGKEDEETVSNYMPTEIRVPELKILRRIVAEDSEAAGYIVTLDADTLAEKAKRILEGKDIDFSERKVEPVLDNTLSALVRWVLGSVAKELVMQIDNLGVWFTNKANIFLSGAINREAIEKFVEEEQKRIDKKLADFSQNHPWIDIEGTKFEVSIGPRFTVHRKARPGPNKFGINFFG